MSKDKLHDEKTQFYIQISLAVEEYQFAVFLCHFTIRSWEADMRLVGILNEQYDDRDALISEISKEVSCCYMQ